MTKIKVVGILILILSISLIILSSSINDKNIVHNNIIDTINKQKTFTQEISRNIFYVYRNRDASISELNDSIDKYIDNVNTKGKNLTISSSAAIKDQNSKIALLSHDFFIYMQVFRDQNKMDITYSSIITDQIVKNIYYKNLKLVTEYDKLIKIYQTEFNERQKSDKTIRYALYLILLLLFVYLFTQIKIIIAFIQKFLDTSSNIITNSTIRELEPMEMNINSFEIIEATNNFNFLVDKINSSLECSSKSINHAYQSFELVEKNIEEFLELIYAMQEEKIDKELTKKEDALIQSLEELTTSAQKLKNLKVDLDNLVSHAKNKQS